MTDGIGLFEALFGPSCGDVAALSFYGEWAYTTIKQQEAEDRRLAELKRKTAPDRIDDVAGQIKGLT